MKIHAHNRGEHVTTIEVTFEDLKKAERALWEAKIAYAAPGNVHLGSGRTDIRVFARATERALSILETL